MADYILLTKLPPQFFDKETPPNPLSGGTLEFYEAGTTNPQNMFSDGSGTILGTSVTLDAQGQIPTVKLLWGQVGLDYKIVLKDSAGVEYWTIDNIVTDEGILTFVDQITINVPTSKPPFVLNSLAQDQVVTGLNADKVDGANVGTNNGEVVLKENIQGILTMATETSPGKIEISTQVETDTGEDGQRAVTPATLAAYAELAINKGHDIKQEGHYYLPATTNGDHFLLNWGKVTTSGAVTFDEPFPSTCFGVAGSVDSSEDKIFLAQSVSNTGFTARLWDTSSQSTQANTAYWFAWGK